MNRALSSPSRTLHFSTEGEEQPQLLSVGDRVLRGRHHLQHSEVETQRQTDILPNQTPPRRPVAPLSRTAVPPKRTTAPLNLTARPPSQTMNFSVIDKQAEVLNDHIQCEPERYESLSSSPGLAYLVNSQEESKKAFMQNQLSKAMDDEDLDRLSSLLVAANRIGIWSQDYQRAQRMVDFKAQKQILNELEAVRVLMTGVTDAVRLIKADLYATGKPCATVEKEKVAREGTGAQPPEPWLKMVRDTVCEGVNQGVTQAVQIAASDATKDLLLECQRLQNCQPDYAANAKPCAMADTEKMGVVGMSQQMPESWLKMVQDVVCDCLDQRLTQAVQEAVSEVTKDLLWECWRLRECKQVQSQVPKISRKAHQYSTTTSSETGKLTNKESELLKQKTGGKSTARKNVPPLDFSALSNSQQECKSMKLLSDAVPGITGENAPWPTRPSALRGSISRVKSSPSLPSYRQVSALSAVESVESKPNHTEVKPFPGHGLR